MQLRITINVTDDERELMADWLRLCRDEPRVPRLASRDAMVERIKAAINEMWVGMADDVAYEQENRAAEEDE